MAPDSIFQLAWDTLVYVTIVYTVLAVPFQIAFDVVYPVALNVRGGDALRAVVCRRS